MAVHSVSLQWVAQIRHSFAEQERNRALNPDSQGGADDKGSISGDPNDHTTGQPNDFAGVTVRSQPTDLDQTALGLSPSEVEELVEQLGPAGGQAVLLLVYKLSSIESELSAMRTLIGNSGLQGFAAAVTDSGPELPTDKVDPATEMAGAPGILDQVFSSNLALYNSMK